MAGIAGVVYPDVFQVDHIASTMLDVISHRGEPHKEIVTFKNIQVGICGNTLERHASLIIGLDGTLYNRKELYLSLEKEGYHSNNETSDSLLIAYAYETWGSSFLTHIAGDFAFFILDQKKMRLLLARDRIGKKPLYWYHDKKNFLFGSELKSILASGVVPQTLAPDAIATYLYFGYIPQDMTPVEGVNKLLPAYYLQFNEDHSKLIHNYWSYSSQFQQSMADSFKSKNSLIDYLDSLVSEVVLERIPKERPFGCFVSGGLGSATIAYYLSKLASKEQVHAYTVAFQGENLSDLKAAQEVTDSLHLQHYCEIITPQTFLDDLLRISWYLDEPLADPNVIATWKLAALAKQSKVVFSGMGGDELFAGHGRYTIEEGKPEAKLDWLSQGAFSFLKEIFLPIFNILYKPGAYSILQHNRTNPWQLNFLNQNAIFTNDIRNEAAPRISHLFDPHSFVQKFHNISRIKSPVASYIYFDIKSRMVDSFILQNERLTSANGLAWRTPFLARKIVEFLASLPEPKQLHESETFSLLKDLMQGKLGDSFINRPKKSRPDFLKSWVESSGLSQLFLIMSKGTLVEMGLISERWLIQQINNPAQRYNSFKLLWSILSLEIWVRLFINRPVSSKPPQISIEELLSE